MIEVDETAEIKMNSSKIRESEKQKSRNQNQIVATVGPAVILKSMLANVSDDFAVSFTDLKRRWHSLKTEDSQLT